MDVDSTQHTRNSPLISYFDVTNQFPWQEPRAEQIRHRRTLMYNTLIFDILLTSGGIREPYLLFPPEDVESLQKLLDAIQNSTYDTLKKDCLVYFLLKWHQDGREKGFQQQRCIPPQFAALADAYWHLDTGINVPRAVAILSDCRLNRDHTSKIMVALSNSPDSEALIRRYVQTAKPPLVEPLDLEMYTLALADSSILDAWHYTRTFSETDEMRPRLFKKMLEWAVTPNPRSAALAQLVTLPLSTFEESVLNDFVQKPPSDLKFSAVAVLQDLICVRLIQGGRYTEAVKLDRQFISTTSPKNLKMTHDRTKMVHDVYAALPSVERALLDLELDPSSPTKPQLVPKNVSPDKRKPVPHESQDSPLSQSWEDVRMPDALVNKSTPLREVRVPVTPLSMPRFGGPSLQTPIAAPILPVNINSMASSSALTPRKSLPLAASAQARPSMSGVGTRMLFTSNAAIASPVSGIKFSKDTTASSPGPGHGFVSATRQQNAFYQPPTTKSNGVKRPFEETTQSPERPERPERPDISTNDADVVMAVEQESDRPERSSKRGQKGRVAEQKDKAQESEHEDENTLQFSVFKGRDDHSSPEPPSRRKIIPKSPPGSYVSDDDDAMDADHDEPRKTTRSRGSRPTRSSKPQAISKPPAKKARQVKNQETRMNIPGSLMDDDDELEEEEDHVAPLRAPSPPRRAVRKARSSVSVDMDEEGIQTRRRSSRLTTTGTAYGSAHSGSPEPPVAVRTKKGTRGGAKKKR
ncbi:hypothetical protein BYT27DRAFT_7226558 [Phlegmacium glaucopus]|nr:hypothetical protein BYT27DRAFT_7226558 [Phlegmacium glaucopus]